MAKIKKALKADKSLTVEENPTVEAEVFLEIIFLPQQFSPSGASTGA